MTAKKNENVRKSVIKNKFLEYVQTQKLVKVSTPWCGFKRSCSTRRKLQEETYISEK